MKHFELLILIILFITSCGVSDSNKQQAAKQSANIEFQKAKPNIILILLDDVSAREFSFYGGSGINTPTIDKMANDGVVFKTAWSQPTCGPTRAMLLTGKYAHKNGHYSNYNLPSTSLHDTHYTLGNAMKDAGYRTGFFGKQHIDREKNPDEFGFDRYTICKYWDGYDGPSQGRGSKDDRAGNMYGAMWYWHPAIFSDGKGVPTTPADFGPQIELDSLVSFVGEDAKEPFFAYWPTNLPHHEYAPADDRWYRPDVPAIDEAGNMTGGKIAGSLASNIEYMDFAIQKLLKKLEEANKLDETILFVIGDNGSASYGKGKTTSELALHVPFMAYGPGKIEPRGMSDILVDMTDIFPTFLDLAKANEPKISKVDGKSFAPYLYDEPFQARQWISAQQDSARWLRTPEWLLDGDGVLWYCGDEFDESKFEKVVSMSLEVNANKRAELQELLDQNIPKFESPK